MTGAKEIGVGGVGNTTVEGGTVGRATEVGVLLTCEVEVTDPGVGRNEAKELLAGRVGLGHKGGMARMATTSSTRMPTDIQPISLFIVASLCRFDIL